MKILFLLNFLFMSTFAQKPYTYPSTKKINQIDTYHGTEVADPYRWLEDDRSAETAAWVKDQNATTQAFLEKIPYRDAIKARIEKLFNYPKYGSPFRKGEWYYFYKNNGLQNQSVLYRQKGLNAEPELVIDPNSLSEKGTTRMVSFSLSQDGKYAAYYLSKGGSDWQEAYIMDLETKKNLSDHVERIKVSGLAWEGNGFYYSSYPLPKDASALAGKNENHIVYYHKIGTPQSEDKIIYEDAKNPQRFHNVGTNDDQDLAFLNISDRGKGLDGNAIFYKRKGQTDFTPIIPEVGNFDYLPVENFSNTLIFRTNEDAKNGKIVSYDLETKKWTTLIPEQPEPLEFVTAVGGKLIVSYLKDVTSKVKIYSPKGELIKDLILPGLGSVSGFGGEKSDTETYYTFTSFTYPPTIFKLDLKTFKSTIFRKPEVAFKPEDFETKQIFYKSKDGTKVPMFIVYKKGLKLNAKNPTLLYGYGGFNINVQPGFSATLIPFLEMGGVYASANIRGGAEYGETWHQGGMKLKKQNVFDDFIAAAEYLKSQKYTSSDYLALRGGSNGGLLVGAVINQRPELCKVAIPQVGVMDMLRFQKFTIGWNWIADYGSSDNPEEFKALYKYSPLHNINAKAKYPATLITTADHDDRVVPAHSFKYAAELQEKAGWGSNPLLIRIDVDSGHGASNTQKNIASIADIYAFIFKNMGFTPKL